MFRTLKEFSRTYEREGADGESPLDTLHHELTHETDETSPTLMLRRLKEDHIAELPGKEIHRRVVNMPLR